MYKLFFRNYFQIYFHTTEGKNLKEGRKKEKKEKKKEKGTFCLET